MSNNKKYPLKEAYRFAKQLVEDIKPYIERLTVVGSVRRQKDLVKDIEIIVKPKVIVTEQADGLFGDIEIKKEDLLEKFILDRTDLFQKRVNILGSTMFGDKNKLVYYKGFPLDVFYADDTNWTMQKFIRTGGKDNNALVATLAKRSGYKVEYYKGCITELNNGEEYYPKNEKDIFDFFGLEYRDPKDRR